MSEKSNSRMHPDYQASKSQEIRKRHGSPTFYKLLEQAADIHDRKSHDYASNDNPYGNYHFAGLVSSLFSHSPEDAGFAGRIAEKMFRLANLEGSGKVVLNESVEDTETDIVTITALWMADRRDRRSLGFLGSGVAAVREEIKKVTNEMRREVNEQGYQPEPIARSEGYEIQCNIMKEVSLLTDKELKEIIQQLSYLVSYRTEPK